LSVMLRGAAAGAVELTVGFAAGPPFAKSGSPTAGDTGRSPPQPASPDSTNARPPTQKLMQRGTDAVMATSLNALLRGQGHEGMATARRTFGLSLWYGRA
jgi:hypothetical protein